MKPIEKINTYELQYEEEIIKLPSQAIAAQPIVNDDITVYSSEYGYGVVTRIENNEISIRYDDSEEVYDFPAVFDPKNEYASEEILSTDDDRLLAQLPNWYATEYATAYASYLRLSA